MTARALVAFARECLSLKTVYVWGGLGEVLTHEFLDEKERAYPDFQSHEKWLELHRSVDGITRGFDCSGLIKRFLMGGIRHFRYRNELDQNSFGLLNGAALSGDIAQLPEIPGVCLYMHRHTGIYVGNGNVVEATPNPQFGNGVVRSKLSDRSWEQWYFCRGIDYPEGVPK